MLKTWTLQYFKSVYEKTSLELAPLTIFSGANSSGKTTIIQSLLLTAQTLQSPLSDRPVILNGNIIKLGSFKDIVSNGHEAENILIGFGLSIDSSKDKTKNSNLLYARDIINLFSEINCQYQFSAATSNDNTELIQLQLQLKESKIELRYQEPKDGKNEKEELHIIKTNQPIEKKLKPYKLTTEKLEQRELFSLGYEVLNSQKSNTEQILSRMYYRNIPSTGNYIGASLNHFLPNRISIVFNETEEQANQLLEGIITAEDDFYFSPAINPEECFKIIGNSQAKNIIIEIIEESSNHQFSFNAKTKTKQKFLDKFEDLRKDFSIQNLAGCYQSLSSRDKQILGEALNIKRNDLKNAIKSNSSPKYAIYYTQLPRIFDIAVDYIKKYFTQCVKYLGPLRDEPKAVYPLAQTTDSEDIGLRGEHTVAVLEINRHTKVKYISSEQFASGNFTPKIVETNLPVAVLDWLKYMDIANEFKTADQGVFGYELKVSQLDSPFFHNLTHVGVGVSQVLPILVQSLLADSGSTLIFEQPELHLHPKVQTRLADFFISMIMLKKQCIVETHSEYLINRLRYLAITAQDYQISQDALIYFVEKQGEKSHYRPLRINEFGAIDWPKGFFDENEQNSRSIIKAVMEKRKKILQK